MEGISKMKQEDAFELPKDIVNHPKHYTSGSIECLDAMESMMEEAPNVDSFSNYHWGIIFKYIWRWPHKEDPLNDLKKAEFYLKNLIKRLENEKK